MKNKFVGSCEDHVLANKAAICWPYLGKRATVFNQQCEILHGTCQGTFIKIQEYQFVGSCEDHVLAIKGPYFGHF